MRVLLIYIAVAFTASAQDYAFDIDDAYKQSIGGMDSVVRSLLKILNESQKEDFEKVQKNWRLFAESESRFKANLTSGGGSSYSYDYLSNLIFLTDGRVKELTYFYKKVKDNNLSGGD